MNQNTKKCTKCNKTKSFDMFSLSRKRGMLNKWCKECHWTEKWNKVNGGNFFSKKAERNLSEIYSFLSEEKLIEVFIHEIDQAARQKAERNYNYVAIRLGRSIEFLTFVLCDFYDVNVGALADNLVSARESLEQIQSKYAAIADKFGDEDFSSVERQEIRNAFKKIISNLVEFEIEIAVGKISPHKDVAQPPIQSLLRRVGKKTDKKKEAHHSVQLVGIFMEYRNFAAHADPHGKEKHEIKRSNVRSMLNHYEEVLASFAALVR